MFLNVDHIRKETVTDIKMEQSLESTLSSVNQDEIKSNWYLDHEAEMGRSRMNWRITRKSKIKSNLTTSRYDISITPTTLNQNVSTLKTESLKQSLFPTDDGLKGN